MVFEDVHEEMPVNGGEEREQFVLFQQGGSITTLSGLKATGLESSYDKCHRVEQTRIVSFKMEQMCVLPSPRSPAKPAPLL